MEPNLLQVRIAPALDNSAHTTRNLGMDGGNPRTIRKAHTVHCGLGLSDILGT